MTKPIAKFPISSLLSFRRSLRDGHLFVFLDASGIDSLSAFLKSFELEYTSLFTGEDAILLENEAPYIVLLEKKNMPIWKPLIQLAQNEHVGFVLKANSDVDSLRRHWKKWLTVKLEGREKPVLFRFYDPRILVTFLSTLSASEASAFYGEATAFYTVEHKQVQSYIPTQATLDATPLKFGIGDMYVINESQVKAMEEVVSQTFKDKLFRYFRVVWEEETKYLTDEDLKAKINLAIEDAIKIGSTRENDVFDLAHVHILRPDIMKDKWIWEQVMNHESQRAGLRAGGFLGYYLVDFKTVEEYNAFFAKLGRFSQEDF